MWIEALNLMKVFMIIGEVLIAIWTAFCIAFLIEWTKYQWNKERWDD